MNQLLTDKKLLELCNEYGKKALIWRQKFIGLLPEVAARNLYLKANCLSIFEFAKKKAGLSEKQVRLALNLSERFEDKPALKNLLVKGEVSINKLARIASIATNKTQEFWAEQSRILPKKSLETLVKDERIASDQFVHLEESLPGQKFANGEVCLAVEDNEQLQLSPELKSRLMEMQGKKINIDELLMKLLDKHEEEIAKDKLEAAEKCKNSNNTKSPSRYISVKIRKLLHAEFGHKCAIPHCIKDAKSIHHTARFALSQNHNPCFLAPLCKEHHDIAHSIDRRVAEHKGLKSTPQHIS